MQVQRHLNRMEYIQCPEFFTTPAVFISDVIPLMMTAGVVKILDIAYILLD